MNNFIVINYSDTSKSINDEKKKTPKYSQNIPSQLPRNNENSKKCCIKRAIIIISVLAALIIGLVVYFIIIRKRDPYSPPHENPIDTTPQNKENETDIFHVIIPNYEINNPKMESEFEFKTETGEIRRINVVQKYNEDRLYNGQKISRIKERRTDYDIFIISESEPEEDCINYYNKKYTAAISIVKECFVSDNEECIPETLIDLTNPEIHNTRNLEEINDLKDIPIPICLFNLTNNDVITSIKCPESFPEDKKKLLVLDLYFFRPPGLKRFDKEKLNITITIEKKGETFFIRETNGGICDIENSFLSFCTTDMNTTTNLEGRILHYEEEAYMKIETDDSNNFIKDKKTKLVDITNENNSLDPQKYNSTLNDILKLLNPYLKYEELFSKSDFEEVLLISKEGPNALKKLKESKRRKLSNDDNQNILITNNLLEVEGNVGVKIGIDLMNNPGLYNEFMEAKSVLKIENKNQELTTSKKSSLSIYEIINSLVTLSQAGNQKATELAQNTNSSLDNMTEYIDDRINYLNNLVKYKDISDIFDATLSLDSINILPFKIIIESSNLRNTLNQLLISIENGGIKNNIKILNSNIYDYLRESHRIINELFDNLSELTKSLNSVDNKLAEISTYYLKNTSISYLSTIEASEKILMSYYKDEYNLIKAHVDKIIKEFGDSVSNSLLKQMNIINNLYEKMENHNYTIENANEENFNTIVNNLYYLKNFMSELIPKINEKIINEMGIKDNGYLMTEYDINSNEERSIGIITNAKEIAQNLDNDTYIDNTFDRIMSNFRKNFTNIQIFMDKEKEEKFPLNEHILENEHFSDDVLKNIENEINQNGINIINKLRKENEDYLKEKDRVIGEFITNEQDNLNMLTFEIDSLFIEKKLEELSKLFEVAFNSSITIAQKELSDNYNVAKKYFNDLTDIFQNDEKLLNLLKKYKTDNANLLKHNPYSSLAKYEFKDTISQKYETKGYLSKYETYIKSFSKSREFINQVLPGDLLSEYKNLIFQLRELLQKFKNNKLTGQYQDTSEFFFIDNHIETIDKLYNRINNTISDTIYNKKFVKIFDNYKKTANDYLDDIDKYIANKNRIIDNNSKRSNEIIYDFCLTFKRKITYTCTNGAHQDFTDTEEYCYPIVLNNLKNLLTHSTIYKESNYIKFKNAFNNFYSSINSRVQQYSLKITNLKNGIINAEQVAINKKYTLDYLSPIQNYIDSILDEKYGEELVKKAYDYYQSNIKNLTEPLLNSISDKWIEAYSYLIQDIKNNLDNFKNSITEFPHMASIYQIIIKNNATINYFNSIEIHQKSEFNYTISYYYNILLKNIKSVYQLVKNKIPNNRKGYNNLLNIRRNEINECFKNIIDIILKSKENSLNAKKQTNILHVPNTNFFKINDVLSNNRIETDNSLQAKISELNAIKFFKKKDEYSIASRFYLENQQSKLQIDELYDQITSKVFVVLNLKEFEKMLKDNWIFDQDEFINQLNNTLYNYNLEIEKEFSNHKNEYKKKLEEYIYHFFTKETLINRISELFINETKEFKDNQIKEIRKIIEEILQKIKQYIDDESKLIQQLSTSYNNNFTKINNRINMYKSQIFNKLNGTIFSVLESFYQNMIIKVHNEFVLEHVNQCISESKKYTKTYSDYDLLNSTYKISDIIDNIIYNIVLEIKNLSKNQIDYMYKQKYEEIKNNVSINDLQKLINEQIDQEFNSKLLPALNNAVTAGQGVTGYTEYDFNNTILTEINSFIEIKINSIKSIIDSSNGSNFNIDINSWEKDCSRITQKVQEIYTSFQEFMDNEKKDQEDNFNEFMQNIIKDNFNNLLNNIIPSFGNDFFSRIINYNENFKISSLYDSLTYSLSQTMSYYILLQSFSDINSLTKDLKLKLLTLNNLDATVKEKNNEVINLLKEEANSFIVDSKEFLINKYQSYLTSDLSIELSFNTNIYNKIKNNFNLVRGKIETDYMNLLNKYFKEQLIESYSKIMNDKTAHMIDTIKDQRELLKANIDDFFTLEPEDVLNNINLKLNNTWSSIEQYKLHFNEFKISEGLIQFLNSYGDNSLKPNYDQFIIVVNEATKNKIISTVEQNSIDYINYFNLEQFNETINDIFLNTKAEYIDNINNAIEDYGIEDYPIKLERKIEEINEKKRMRGLRILTDEEIREKVADKALDETFTKILNSSNNAKNFIYSLNKFDEFISSIEKNINNLNYAYKYSLNLIKKNNYEKEIENILIQKLNDLKNKTLNYYNNINDLFTSYRDYIFNSISKINNKIKECANITYNIFSEKYTNISKEVKSIDEEDSKVDSCEGSVSIPNQNKNINVDYKISNLIKKAKFEFDLIFEGTDIKKPRVKIKIINQDTPGDIKFNIIEPQNNCGKITEIFESDTIKNVNFSLSIDFYTNSTDLYITTFGDFDSYYINKELKEIEEKTVKHCFNVMGNYVCSEETNCDEQPKILSPKTSKLVPKKIINEFSIIHID